ncbi:MAG: AAA family ATPase [Candidatus Kapabacteria bacterium]|nr:AAA family ATPase [Candidatus Kapabacteria bacterium]
MAKKIILNDNSNSSIMKEDILIHQMNTNCNKYTEIFSHNVLRTFAFESFKKLITLLGEAVVLSGLTKGSSIFKGVVSDVLYLNSISSNQIIRIFPTSKTAIDLTDLQLRYVPTKLKFETIYLNEYCYFSNQWSYKSKKHKNSDFINYKEFIKNISSNQYDIINDFDNTKKKPTNFRLIKCDETKYDGPLNQILYGPPGTGKTYSTFDKAVEIVKPFHIYTDTPSKHEQNVETFKGLLDKQIFFITFHQNYSYEDFVIGIKPSITDKPLSFTENYGIFLKACAACYGLTIENFLEYCKSYYNINNEPKANDDNKIKIPQKDVVLVIDEINRANISRVFGELITIIEEDKRIGNAHELILTLPGGVKFGVPPNLYILGTMNTADKSIAHIDVALRRRFKFIPLYPKPELIEDKFKEGKEKREFLIKINTKIFEIKKSAEYLIGHSFFMNNLTLDEIILSNIIPLVSEYFSGDEATIINLFVNTGKTVEYNKNTYEWEVHPKEESSKVEIVK